MEVTDDDIDILVNLEHLEKQYSPIDFKEAGIVICCNEEHPEKE